MGRKTPDTPPRRRSMLSGFRMLQFMTLCLCVGLAFSIALLPPASAAATRTLPGRGLKGNFLTGLQATLPPTGSLITEDQAALYSWVHLLTNDTPNNVLRQRWESQNASAPCGWPEVHCGAWGGETRVTELDLSRLNLSGPMPVGLGRVTGLVAITVAFNLFNGSIPADIGNCSNLQTLDFTSNSFSGHVPLELFTNCQNLKSFNASSNKLQGKLPDELWSCPNMQEILLSNNHLSGNLSVGSGGFQLRALTRLALNQNFLSGNMPDVLNSIGFTQLQLIDLSYNRFRGTIPSALGRCNALSYINFQGNELEGIVPEELGQLGNLQCLGLGKNKLTGTLPASLTQCRALYLIDISRNSLSGGIPMWLSQMASLKYLTMHSNNLTGGVPLELMQSPTLYHFDVGNNSLGGEIPPELGNLTSLRFLRLAMNQFIGAVPAELGLLTSLQGLDLSANGLTGGIPSTLGNLRDLLWLQLADNQLNGSIPSALTNCNSLLWLNLQSNRLSGEIPSDFFRLGVNALAAFSKNQQAIVLPMDIGECSLAKSWIPGEVAPFSDMAKTLKHDRCLVGWQEILRGNHPVLGYWQLSNNSLTGPIPTPVSQSNLSCLLLSYNFLSGPIPPSIADVPLINLDLSHNQISGSIPGTIDKLAPTLQSLDVSHNNLVGPFPQSLNFMNFLSSFNFSFNPGLTGPVPNENSFKNFNVSAYLGDPNLCQLPDPTQRVDHKQREMPLCGGGAAAPAPGSAAASAEAAAENATGFQKHLVLACTLISVFGMLLVLLLAGLILVLASKWRSHQLGPKQVAVFMDSDSEWRAYETMPASFQVPVKSFGLLKALTYSDLMVATDNFSPANIIGDGGFGIVYKAKLADGTAVAIKKLVQDGAQGEREFQAEMETLGLIQHANLVPLLGYCCRLRERLLVYKCLRNGSLDDWLYEGEERTAALPWPTRLRIAVGTARGLCFLHHECVPLIIHRDMKTSNILLDENFDACLTDFGLARLMDLQMTHVSTVVAGTPGYVPPEYGETWRATAKGDVYSFGVVMLELASGKRPIGPEFHGLEGGNLVEWVNILTSKDRRAEVYDPVVMRTSEPDALSQFLSLAMACTSEVRLRPTMLQVTAKLEELKSREQAASGGGGIACPYPVLPNASRMSGKADSS